MPKTIMARRHCRSGRGGVGDGVGVDGGLYYIHGSIEWKGAQAVYLWTPA